MHVIEIYFNNFINTIVYVFALNTVFKANRKMEKDTIMTTESNLEKSDIDALLLNPEKQHVLIEFLEKYSSANVIRLAHLLAIPQEKLRDVQKQKDCLNLIESKKLMDYFCIWCGS
ncbi:MAG: hypothetical protein A3F13_03525 [Gammaproteobacteria bacterium RIFCSPHIGHO2_12_FULL_40_19]|nr:MAG: hypothetical protein A3F13_03525 [Gammaproteobacteria bacterium RIFCSPHIGHO2_12_FULL_40_19]